MVNLDFNQLVRVGLAVHIIVIWHHQRREELEKEIGLDCI